MGASVDRDVESGVMLLTRELIVFDGEGTGVPENALDYVVSTLLENI